MATRLSPLEGLRKNREKGERRGEEMVKKSWAEGEMGKLKLVKKGKWDVMSCSNNKLHLPPYNQILMASLILIMLKSCVFRCIR